MPGEEARLFLCRAGGDAADNSLLHRHEDEHDRDCDPADAVIMVFHRVSYCPEHVSRAIVIPWILSSRLRDAASIGFLHAVGKEKAATASGPGWSRNRPIRTEVRWRRAPSGTAAR